MRMKTLIELYDERPLDNVLATEMFRPEETVYVCPPEVAGDAALRASLRRYFKLRGCGTRLSFVPVSMLDEPRIEKKIRQIIDTRTDCAIDSTLFSLAPLISLNVSFPVAPSSFCCQTALTFATAPSVS